MSVFCVDCKHFGENGSSPLDSICDNVIVNEPNAAWLVTKRKTELMRCTVARQYDQLCGQTAIHFIPKDSSSVTALPTRNLRSINTAKDSKDPDIVH